MEDIKTNLTLEPFFAQAGRQICYAAGETIYLQGENAEHLYYISQGRVRAFYVTKSGKELTFEIIEKGRIIGESSFLSHSLYPVTVTAVTDVVLLACTLDQLWPQIESSRDLTLVILRLLSGTCNHLTEQLRRITLYDRYQKIASFLLHETAEPDPDRGVTSDSIPYTHEELAMSLGMNRVTVSRVLGEWKKQRIVSTAYGCIRILDREHLSRLLHPSGSI